MAFPMGLGRVFILMVRKSMKVITNLDTKLVNGYTLIRGNKSLEEEYFICEDDCDKSHPSLGKIIKSEKF